MRHREPGPGGIERSINPSPNILHAVDLRQLAGPAGAVRYDGAVGVVDRLVDHVQDVVLPVQRQPRRRVRRRVERRRLRQAVAVAVAAAVRILEERKRGDVAAVRGDVEVCGTGETHEGGESDDEEGKEGLGLGQLHRCERAGDGGIWDVLSKAGWIVLRFIATFARVRIGALVEWTRASLSPHTGQWWSIS